MPQYKSKLSEIDGSETRVTVSAEVTTVKPLTTYYYRQKGGLRDGSVHSNKSLSVLLAKSDQPNLKMYHKYRFTNVKTRFAGPDRPWGPEVQIIIDDQSEIECLDDDDDDGYSKHNPTGSNGSRANDAGKATARETELRSDVGLTRGGP